MEPEAAVFQGNGADAKLLDDAKRKVAPELCWTAERVAADLKLSRRAFVLTLACRSPLSPEAKRSLLEALARKNTRKACATCHVCLNDGAFAGLAPVSSVGLVSSDGPELVSSMLYSTVCVGNLICAAAAQGAGR